MEGTNRIKIYDPTAYNAADGSPLQYGHDRGASGPVDPPAMSDSLFSEIAREEYQSQHLPCEQ